MAFLMLVLILALFGTGFAIQVLWYVAIAALIMWCVGFIARGPQARWYRW